MTIICPVHGEFQQKAGSHLKYGCPKCARNSPITIEEFIKRAKKAHGNKYDYSKVVLKGTSNKVTIICPIHGEFEQRASDHLRGCGCNKCRLSKSTKFEPIKGKTRTREYRIWKGMKTRVTNSNTDSSDNYINRGIKCCDEWLESFEAFYNDMGNAPKGYSLDRINPNGDYCPENCRWASAKIQAENRGDFNDVFTFNNETHVLKEWSRIVGIKYGTLHARIYRGGLSFEDAIQKDPYHRLIDLNGEKHILKDWCKIYNIKYNTVINRIHKHKWDLERAITTPGKSFEG